jgi:hypothetical protein
LPRRRRRNRRDKGSALGGWFADELTRRALGRENEYRRDGKPGEAKAEADDRKQEHQRDGDKDNERYGQKAEDPARSFFLDTVFETHDPPPCQGGAMKKIQKNHWFNR